MGRQGGLGRGLASLIPNKQKKAKAKDEDNEQKEEISSFAVFDDEENYEKEIERKEVNDFKLLPKRKTKALPSGMERIPADNIFPNPFQPRKYFDEEKLNQLAESIKLHGVLQPLLVSKRDDGKYELIAGERRLEASKIANIFDVPVVVKNVNDKEKAEIALIENIQRHDLNPIEESRAYLRLQEEFALTQEELAQRVGKGRSSVANSLRLLKLPIEIQNALGEGKISEGHARAILSVENPEKQRALFFLIVGKKLSVREAERKVREVSVKSHIRKITSKDPELLEKEDELATIFGTKVQIKKKKNSGQIEIEFYSDEELEAILNKIKENEAD